ncbi:MAG: hypothetical protein JWQ81_3313 [Amycolatopsis sp.]|jgi:hypothetical protein|nr:hypothetical protein [Amycolatopsis sp.]
MTGLRHPMDTPVKQGVSGSDMVFPHRDNGLQDPKSWSADVAQLVAHHLAKVRVASSNLVVRSTAA